MLLWESQDTRAKSTFLQKYFRLLLPFTSTAPSTQNSVHELLSSMGPRTCKCEFRHKVCLREMWLQPSGKPFSPPGSEAGIAFPRSSPPSLCCPICGTMTPPCRLCVTVPAHVHSRGECHPGTPWHRIRHRRPWDSGSFWAVPWANSHGAECQLGPDKMQHRPEQSRCHSLTQRRLTRQEGA